MLEKLLAAEVLEVRVLNPALAQSLVGKVVSVLEDRHSRHQPRRQRRLTRLVGVDRPEPLSQKTPIDRPRQLHQRVVHVDDLIKPRAEQILLAGLPSLAWSHRKSPLHQREREESWLAIRGNPQNRIRKEIALQRPKTGKFDYLSEPNHPAHSMAFKFFTDDCIKVTPGGNGELRPVLHLHARHFAGGGPRGRLGISVAEARHSPKMP